jgi:hypothetical protein
LERLQLDYIDVLQCHRFDKSTPIEETMQALHDVVQSGMVRYIGMSSCWAWQFQIMQRELQPSLRTFLADAFTFCRVRAAKQAHHVHFDAEPTQRNVPGGREGDDADSGALWRGLNSLGPARSWT